MGITRLDFGTAANNDGEVLRTAFPKLDANDADLDARVTSLESVGVPDLADHVAAADPHPQYLDTTRGDARYYTQDQTYTRTEVDQIVGVSVMSYGATGDGVTDDTTAIQLAAATGLNVNFPAGSYLISDTITLAEDGQVATLDRNAIVSLDTATTSKRVFSCEGDRSGVVGGRLTTTLRTLLFLVDLVGDRSFVRSSELYYATKSAIAPIGGTDIPYNRGGIALNGENCSVTGCEIYNQEGGGIIAYATGLFIVDNHIHDNVYGIHTDASSGSPTGTIARNKIIDNDVNHAQGADGILCNNTYFSLIIEGNTISGCGEHGMYVRGNNSTISHNRVTGNYGAGIKIRQQVGTVVVGNVCRDNQTDGDTTGAQIYVQASGTCSDIAIVGNIALGSTGYGIRTAYATGSGESFTRVEVSNNTAASISLAFDSECTVSGNVCSGAISVGAADTYAPTPQTGAFIFGNKCTTLTMGRCTNADILFNHVTTLNHGSAVASAANRYIGNRVSAQATQLSRQTFDMMALNRMEISSVSGDVLDQGSNASRNSDKIVALNRFDGENSVRIMDDSSSSASGEQNVVIGNMVNNSLGMVSIWGDGHTVVGNVNRKRAVITLSGATSLSAGETLTQATTGATAVVVHDGDLTDASVMVKRVTGTWNTSSGYAITGSTTGALATTCTGYTAAGATGYVGMNNSWLHANSPAIPERAGTTGNSNV